MKFAMIQLWIGAILICFNLTHATEMTDSTWVEDFTSSTLDPNNYGVEDYWCGPSCDSIMDKSLFMGCSMRLINLRQYDLSAFTASFRVKISGAADGMVFYWYPDLDPPRPIGGLQGHQLGWIWNDTRGVGLKFQEGFGNQVAVVYHGVGNPVASMNYGPLNNNAWHDVALTYDNGQINVTLDGTQVLSTLVPHEISQGYFMVSSACGGASADHWLDEVNVTTSSSLAIPCYTKTGFVREDFDGSIGDSCWFWLLPDSQHVNLSTRPGWITIMSQEGELQQVLNNNNLLRRVIADSFLVETHLGFSPNSNTQIAGIQIRSGTDHFLSLARCFSDGQYLTLRYVDGYYPAPNPLINIPYSGGDVYLRLQVTDNQVAGYWSVDGNSWESVGIIPDLLWLTLRSKQVGLYALNGAGNQSEIPADFDYFRVDSLPSCPYSKVYVPQQFSTVEEALVATCDGDTIMLAAGYYGPIDLTGRPRVLVGAGMDSTFVAGSSTIVGGSTVSQLTATGGAYTYALVVPGGFTSSITFNWVRVTGAHVGLVVSNDPAASDDSLFLNHCVFEFLGAYGVQQEDASLIVDHCVFRDIGSPSWGQQNAGIANCCRTPSGPGHDNLVVRNSVFMNHRLWAIKSNETPDYPTLLSHNCFFANGTNYMPWMQSTNAVYSDPMFVGGSPFDFHTQSNSPLIGTGDPTSPPDPDGTRTDIGLHWNPSDNSNFCLPTEIPFIDDFNSPELDSCWDWIREDTSRWSLSERPGWMRISPYYYNSNYVNWLVRTIVDTNFVIQTKLQHAPEFGTGAGPFIYLDDLNWINAELLSGQIVRTHSMLNGAWDGTNTDFPAPLTSAYMQIEKMGCTYTVSISPDSVVWHHVKTWERSLSADGFIRVGLFTEAWASNFPVADFDYFKIDPVSGTQVCGNLSGVWDSTGSPYYVTCDVTVPAGQTLDIQPGVEVLFTGHYKFNVYGNLQAIGTEQDSIVFTRAFPTEESKWWGIRFYAAEDTNRLSFCRIEWGKADGGTPFYDYYGGGIFCNQSRLVMSNCEVAWNEARYDGGGINIYDCSPLIQECDIHDNRTTEDNGAGGGISIWPSSATISRSRIWNNQADQAGGVYCRNSTPLIVNCTISGNRALGAVHASGGGISLTGGQTTLVNSIVFGNTASAYPAIWIESGSTVATYSNIQGGYPGIGNIDSDPEMTSDFHLQSGSPCINTGDPTSPLDPDGSRADMGAFPYFSPPVCGTVSGTWYANSLVKVACDLLIPDNDTLVIEPGVTVEFLGDYKITVNGALLADGTDTDSILFWTDTTTNPSKWSGVRFVNSDGASVLKNCIFRYGSSGLGDSAVLGGAVFVDSSVVGIENCLFENNQAQFGGAVNLFKPLAGSTLNGCVFRDNASIPSGVTGYGGAVRVRALPLTIEDCLFEGNTARLGAAVNATLCTVDIVNCTFVDNISTIGGHTGNVVQGQLNLMNCVFTGTDSDHAFDIGTGSVAVVFSCIEGWTGPFSNIAEPAGFGDLLAVNVNGDSVDAYGNLFTNPLFDTNEYDLLWNSPAVDAGDSTSSLDSDSTIADQGWKSFYQPTLLVSPLELDFGTLYYGDSET
ncbi:MAG: hypothetical protein IPK53_11725 [bacterium]|nr:hypothetical protein [bacterium]